MGWFDSLLSFGSQALGGASFGIDVGSWFGEDRPDEVRAQNTALQREFAQNSIRWRVKDARKAGLHPLSALGANASAFAGNPVTIGGGEFSLAPAMEALEHRRNREQSAVDRKAQEAVIEREQNRAHALAMSQIATETARQEEARANARRANSEAAWFDQQVNEAKAAKMQNSAQSNKQGAVINPQFQREAVEYKPDQVTSVKADNPAITSGEHAMFQERSITPGGHKMLTFADSDPAESFEGLGALAVLAVANTVYGLYHGAKWWYGKLVENAKAQGLSEQEAAEIYRQQKRRMAGKPLNIVRGQQPARQ